MKFYRSRSLYVARRPWIAISYVLICFLFEPNSPKKILLEYFSNLNWHSNDFFFFFLTFYIPGFRGAAQGSGARDAAPSATADLLPVRNRRSDDLAREPGDTRERQDERTQNQRLRPARLPHAHVERDAGCDDVAIVLWPYLIHHQQEQKGKRSDSAFSVRFQLVWLLLGRFVSTKIMIFVWLFFIRLLVFPTFAQWWLRVLVFVNNRPSALSRWYIC